MITVSIASPQEIHPLPYQRLRDCAKAVIAGEGVKEAKISLAFVDNPTIHRINKQFLEHDEPTDVITFPLSGKGAKKLEGELVIGIEVAIAVAKELGHTTDEELCLYVIHGCLHLCGYTDKKRKEEIAMRKAEAHYLRLLSLPDISERAS
jgi:probable rRNA maturation factor